MSDQEFDARLRKLAAAGKDPAPAGFDARLNEIMEGLTMKKRCLRTIRNVCIAAALCVLLAISALAASPALREALAGALGSFAPYAQTIEGEAVDQGIRARVVSALTDSSGLAVYVEFTDLTGQERLAAASPRMSGFVTIDRPKDEDKPSSFVFGWDRLAYDGESQTLLCVCRMYYDILLPDNTAGMVEIDSLEMDDDVIVKVEDLDAKLLMDSYLKTRKLESGETVLLPGQTENRWTNTAGVTLSSMGYGEDGRLHFLFTFPQGVDPTKSFVLFGVSSKTDPARNIAYNSDMRNVSFTQDGKSYLDYSVVGNPADREDIEFEETYIRLDSGVPAIEGEWRIPITLKKVEERVFPMADDLGGCVLTELRLSPLRVTVTAQADKLDNGVMKSESMWAFFADGSRVELEKTVSGGSRDKPTINRWTFPEAVEDLDQIVGLATGKWYIPIEDGAAGPGYWLDEAPHG